MNGIDQEISSEPKNEILMGTSSKNKYQTSRSTYRQEKTQYGTLHGIDWENSMQKINTRQVGLPTEKGEHSTQYYLESTKYNWVPGKYSIIM
jgi:hypothetical protein